MGGSHQTQDATRHARTGDTGTRYACAHDTDAAESDARARHAGNCHACARSGSAGHTGGEAGMRRASREANQQKAVILNAAFGGFATMAE